MKSPLPNKKNQAYAIISTFMVISVGFLISAGIVSWSSQSSGVTERNAVYESAAMVAETAVEKLAATVIHDFRSINVAHVRSKVTAYSTVLPTKKDYALAGDYAFFDANRSPGKISVEIPPSSKIIFGPVPNSNPVIYGYFDEMSIMSMASNKTRTGSATAMVKQQLKFVEAPICQFQFFYQPEMEISFGSTFQMTGWIHSNSKIQMKPTASLTFRKGVTTASNIVTESQQSSGLIGGLLGGLLGGGSSSPDIDYLSAKEENYKKLVFQDQTSMNTEDLRKLVEPPPSGESATSAAGRERYYNKADMIVRITSKGAVATSGAFDGFSTDIPDRIIDDIISLKSSITDKREGVTVELVEMDISELRSEFDKLKSYLGRYPNTIYVIDARTHKKGAISGVRLTDGEILPTGGLTVATPHPLYVWGNYNAPSAHLNTTNTTQCLPASLVADAITILSPAWKDKNSKKKLSSRRASASTVNASLITGIVPTEGGSYSGGIENSIRFLENWGNINFTFNGSVAVLYYSQIAAAPWGASSEVYEAPNRKWSWDSQLSKADKLPHGIPFLKFVVRDPTQRKSTLL